MAYASRVIRSHRTAHCLVRRFTRCRSWPGYWRVNHLFWQPLRTTEPGKVSDLTYSCTRYTRNGCIGTNNQTSDALLFTDNASNPCAEGYYGAFCAACDWPDYKMNSDTKSCERCEDLGSINETIYMYAGGLGAAVLVMLFACACCFFAPDTALQALQGGK